jgi:hypothetical protein
MHPATGFDLPRISDAARRRQDYSLIESAANAA